MDGDLKSKRVRWKQRTDAAFERMCAGKSAAELVTMDEREEMAMVLAKEMAAFFIAILDFVHLLAYLHGAAHAWRGGSNEDSNSEGWSTYEQWLRWAWSGKVGRLISSLRSALAETKAQGSKAAAASLEEALTYVTNNRERMDYPEYRRLGLPISSAPVESTIKQINRRVKGSEKFWLHGGAEAMLQLRAAQLSQDGRWEKEWLRPRKHHRAPSPGLLGQAA